MVGWSGVDVRRESKVPTRYAVICPEHGRVYMTEAEYDRQAALAPPWRCPRLVTKNGGPCRKPSEFDGRYLGQRRTVIMAPKDESEASVMAPKFEPDISLPVPWAPGTSVRGPEAQVRRYLDTIQEQRIAATQWPADNRQQMTALARMFPTMTRFGGSMVPGTDPWDAEALVNWLNTSGEPTSGSRHAALFLLSVWNRDDWMVHGLKVRHPGKKDWKGARRIGRLDFNDAWASWDAKHRAAALAWFINPFWP